MKLRDEGIDIAKGLGIILVVFNHVPYNNLNFQQFIASFHMPLFFFLFGLTAMLKATRYSVFKELVPYGLMQFKRFLVPYFIFAFIYWDLNAQNIINILYGQPLAIIWFLLTMFLASIFFNFILIMITKIPGVRRAPQYISLLGGAVILFILGIGLKYLLVFLPISRYPWGGDVAVVATAFMLTGAALKQIYEKIKIKRICCLVIGLMLLISVYFVAINDPIIYEQSYSHRVVMSTALYGMYPIFVYTGLAGSLGVLLLSVAIKKLKVLSWLGRNSFGVMILHYWYPLYISTRIVNLTGLTGSTLLYPLLNTVIAMILCIPMILLINWACPFLFGNNVNQVKGCLK